MSVLKKKIEMQSQEVAPPDKLTAPWKNIYEELLPTFEILMSQVKWNVSDYALEVCDVAKLEKAYAKKALYYSFGPKANEPACIIALEGKIAGLVRKCSFAEEIDGFNNIEVKEPSKLDVLLPLGLIDQIASLIERIGKTSVNRDDWDNCFLEKKNVVEFSALELTARKGGWVKMTAQYYGSLGRKVKPECFSVDIIMPYGLVEYTLAETAQNYEEPEGPIDLDECHAELKRHLSHTIMPVRAVLENIELSIADCTRMQLGQVIPLPGVSVSSLRLEAGIDDERSCIANAELGIIKSNRAVRLSQDVETSFIDSFIITN